MKTKKYDYESFLNSPTKKQWEKIGINRKSGVCVPLFSIYSDNSLGIGEIPDLKLLIDWCKQTNLSIIQLLPLNDTGFSFTPYDCQSSFALDPMYLSIDKLKDVSLNNNIKDEIIKLRFDTDFQELHVNYKIKKSKLDIFWKIFSSLNIDSEDFKKFLEQNSFWIGKYSEYKALKDAYDQKSWTEWPQENLKPNPFVVKFYSWLQWQLYEQFAEVKTYAQSRNVFILGDLPLFVSYDSADVWAYRDYFKLDLVSGAPPDAYSDSGQRWGMPTYNWEAMEKNGYDYYLKKLKYAENFYEMFRIDHAIGLFRVWSIPRTDPIEMGGQNGKFDPADESIWKAHGEKLYKLIIDNTTMLPCAEDLGDVPPCSFDTLEEMGIPGIDVQRWLKTEDGNFISNEDYRKNSLAVISTHDMSHFALWWANEISEQEKQVFINYVKRSSSHKKSSFSLRNVAKLALEKVSGANSIFSIQLMHDWLILNDYELLKSNESRINTPGTMSKSNWSIRLPVSLEELNDLEMNLVIKKINERTQRV